MNKETWKEVWNIIKTIFWTLFILWFIAVNFIIFVLLIAVKEEII